MVDDLLSTRIGYATRTALESYTKDFKKKAQKERKLYIDVVEKSVKDIIKDEVKKCYKVVTDQLDWNNPEGHEYPFDLSKPLPLIKAQGRQVVLADYFVNNDLEYLKEQDIIFDLNVALRMFTRCIVVLKQVKDLPLGVKSYQKKLNITKPETFRSDILKLTPYTTYKNPQGIIYQDKFKRNRLMCSDELYKFCDGTLTFIRRVLHDIANNLRMDYLPKRR
nr:hypothetical protein [Tanacetum cinerariifolium]